MRPPSEGKFSALWAEVSHRLQCIHTSAAPGRHIKKHACIGSHAKQVANPSLAYLNLFLFDNLALLLKHLFRFTAVTVRRASHGKIADVKRLARKSVCFSETISISHRELFGNKPTSKRITFNSSTHLWSSLGCCQRHVAAKAWDTKDSVASFYDEGSSIGGVR